MKKPQGLFPPGLAVSLSRYYFYPMSADPLAALFHPFDTGMLVMPAGDILFINGQSCKGLAEVDKDRLTIQQSFKPYAEALEAAGYRVVPDISAAGAFDAVLVAGARQHQENIYAMAAGLNAQKEGGLFLCAAANDAGGRRLKKDAESLGLAVYEDSKHKSRIIWSEECHINKDGLQPAIKAGGYQPVMDGAYISRPGIFGWDKIDTGSALLAQAMSPDDLKGTGADFGCGYGYLSRAVLKKSQAIKRLYCIDADARAVEACRRTLGDDPRAAFLWADLSGPDTLPEKLDFIIMNPPFHEGGKGLALIGQSFIRKAAQSLRPGGTLWMVANSHLPYEDILRQTFTHGDLIAGQNGFKIFWTVT